MKKLIGLLLLAVCLPLAGCMSVWSPGIGILFTDVKWNGEAQGPLGSKEGKACLQTILGLIAQGDASIEAAAKAGGVKSVNSVDHTSKNMLGIMGEYCTIVRGS